MAKRKRTQIPAYRLHSRSGQAVVTLTDANTGRRRDLYLGRFDTPESRQKYAETIAAWEADGRVLEAVKPRREPEPVGADQTVAAVVLRYWRHEKRRYGLAKGDKLPARLYAVRKALSRCRSVCGGLPAADFGPRRMQEVRQVMADAGLNRNSINVAIRQIVRAFRQAVAEEAISPHVITALECVRPLRRGELGAPEGKRVRPVPDGWIAAIRPHLNRHVRALVDLQLTTGARPGELVIMRGVDLTTDGKVWEYRPPHHKTEHHGHERVIYLGPKARAIVEQFLKGDATAYLFSPADAERERAERRRAERTAHPSTNKSRDAERKARQNQRGRPPGDRYTTDSYRRAVHRACQVAGVEKFGVHRLRKNAATQIRKEFGLDAAQVILGHKSANITQLYAGLDQEKAREIAGKVG